MHVNLGGIEVLLVPTIGRSLGDPIDGGRTTQKHMTDSWRDADERHSKSRDLASQLSRGAGSWRLVSLFGWDQRPVG